MVRIDSPEVQDFCEGIAGEAKELGKSVFLVGMGRTPAEPRYELPIEGEGDVCIYVLSRARLREPALREENLRRASGVVRYHCRLPGCVKGRLFS